MNEVLIRDPAEPGISYKNSVCTLGVLISGKINNKSAASRRTQRILKEKFAAADKYGVKMFVFYPDDVCWENRTIKGFKYVINAGKNGYWVKKTFPFPDVVYNRIHNRKLESRPQVKKLLRKLDNFQSLKFFNSRYLDKWEVYHTLQQDPATLAMVPITRLLTYPNLTYVLTHSKEVFIKPRNNNAARGIIKIIQKSPDTYIYRQANAGVQDWAKCYSLKSLWSQIRNMVVTPNDYLVQAGIDLCRYEGRVFDLRAQIQKNGEGKWVFTGMEARVAQKSQFVTTGVNYGKIVPANQILQAASRGVDDYQQKIDAQLQDLAAKIPKCLENNLGLSLGVLSIDIGFNKKGRLWIIEVSSKPEPFANRGIRRRHYQYLMEYILYVSRSQNIS